MATIQFDKCVAKINTDKLLSAIDDDVPNVKTIGIIITGDETDDKLRRTIYGDNRRFAKVACQPEDHWAYIIMDVSKEELSKFAKKIKQNNVIFGQKTEDGIQFDLIDGGKIVSSRMFVKNDFKDAELFYVPFFDDLKSDKVLKIEIGRELSFNSKQFTSDKPRVKQLIEYIRAHNEQAINETNSNYKWLENWNVLVAMKELKTFSEI